METHVWEQLSLLATCPSDTGAPRSLRANCAEDGGGARLPRCSSLHPTPCPSAAPCFPRRSPSPALPRSLGTRAASLPCPLPPPQPQQPKSLGQGRPGSAHPSCSGADAVPEGSKGARTEPVPPAPRPSTALRPHPGALPAAQPVWTRVSAASLRAFRFAFQTCQSRLLPSRRPQMWLSCFSQNFPNTKFQPKADAAHRKFFPPKLSAKP